MPGHDEALPEEFSRHFIDRIEDVFQIGDKRISRPWEYGRTLEQHETFGRGEARPGRRKTSRKRHTVRAERVPERWEEPAPLIPYTYRGPRHPDTLIRRPEESPGSPEVLPYPRPRPKALAADGTPLQITRWVRRDYSWTVGDTLWYEVRPSLRSGRWWRVETDADPERGRLSYATCSCVGYAEGIHLCEHVKPVLRLIRDGVQIGTDYDCG